MAILAVAALLAAHRRPAVAGAASAVIAATLFWGGVTAAIAHYPLYQQRRTVTQDTNRQIGSVLADDALYIGPQWQVAALPLEGRPIRIFNPGLLDDAQLREALTWHLEQGVRIYLAPDEPSDWHRLIAPWGLEAKEHTHGIREIVRKARL